MGRYMVDGPAAVVPARVAAWLERRFDLDRVRIEMRGQDPQLDGVLNALHAVACQWDPAGAASVSTSADGSPVAPLAEVPPASTSMGTPEVAQLADVTTRAVRLAASQGRLRGRRVGGQWVFDMEDVAFWVTSRSA